MEGKAAFRQLGSRHVEERSAIVNRVLGNITNNDHSPETQALADKITQIAGDDPQKAQQVLTLLTSLNKSGHGENNFLPAIPLAMAGITAIGGALVAANPTTQENLRIAANSMVEAAAKTGENAAQSMKSSILIWDVIVGTAFPIHLLDPSNRSLVNPILTDIAVHPSSGGFGDGSVVAPTVHTGGTQLDGRQDDGKYVTPEHRLDPGNMYSDRVELKGLAQNRPLQDLTHQELLGIFGTAGIDLSNHAITRLKDSRTKNIGFETPNDIAKIFNDGTKFDAGNGAVGYGYKGLEVIINPVTKKIVTFRPAKNRE